MIGIIFGVLCITSIVISIFSGNTFSLSNAIFDGADKAVELTICLMGVMCLWSGIMNVLEKKGVISKLSRLISPILRFIFPDSYKKGVGIDEISSNISANILGMGNASTPLGLRAMEKLNSINKKRGVASDDMVMLAVLNTSSIDILPTTLIALRRGAGSASPYDIILPTIIVSFCCFTFAILITKAFSKVF